MEKKTAEEILEIISDHYSEEDFANGEWTECDIAKDFKFSEEVERVRLLHDTAQKEYAAHPGYKDSKQRDEEYERLREVYAACPSVYEQENVEILNHLGIGRAKLIEDIGGEGQGDHAHTVWYFEDHDVYIKIIGHYSSYNGTDYYAGYGREVKPVTKSVVVYE